MGRHREAHLITLAISLDTLARHTLAAKDRTEIDPLVLDNGMERRLRDGLVCHDVLCGTPNLNDACLDRLASSRIASRTRRSVVD